MSSAIGPGHIEDAGAAELGGTMLATVLVGALFGWAGGRFGGPARSSTEP